MRERGPDHDLVLLAVCDDNVCQSPMMERLLRRSLRTEVSSAGLRATQGRPMDPYARVVVSDMGGDVIGIVSQPMTEEHVADADLVLTATRDQKTRLLLRYPKALHRTFTLLEYAQLMPRTEGTTPEEIVASASRNRGRITLPSGDESDLDLTSPRPGNDRDYRALAGQIQTAADRIAGRMAGRTSARGG